MVGGLDLPETLNHIKSITGDTFSQNELDKKHRDESTHQVLQQFICKKSAKQIPGAWEIGQEVAGVLRPANIH